MDWKQHWLDRLAEIEAELDDTQTCIAGAGPADRDRWDTLLDVARTYEAIAERLKRLLNQRYGLDL